MAPPSACLGWSRRSRFLKAIRAALPEDGNFVDEVSQIGFASRVALPIEHPRTFLSPGYQDNLGWVFGTALGAKAAMPDRKVLAIAGDGSRLQAWWSVAPSSWVHSHHWFGSLRPMMHANSVRP